MFIPVHMAMGERVLRWSLQDITPIKKLRIGDHLIEYLDAIQEISITEDLFIIKIVDPVFRDGIRNSASISECSLDVIQAYDWNGNLVWKLSDILPNLKPDFLGGFLIDKTALEGRADTAHLDLSRPLFACFCGPWSYCIDLKTQKVVYKYPVK